MASKLNEFVSRFGKNPKGVSGGIGALLAAAGLYYGAANSFFTGLLAAHKNLNNFCFFIYISYHRITVEGGHRAIIFNRVGGIQPDTIYSEGLHLRVPWFQYPIIYDIRAKPRLIRSPTGSKGTLLKIFGFF